VCLIAVLLTVLASASLAETIPVTHGTTLSGKEIVLPQDLHPGRTILILGFTKKSSESSRDWGKRIAPLLASDPTVAWFQIPILASVPRLVRGMVLSSMKKDVPQITQQYFLPIYEKEREWKQLVSYHEPDDAYIVIVDQSGTVVWKAHGPFTPQRLQEMKDVVR
jgi:hypothetical protein